jgi:nicotinate-nucleotide--dimethylbenzimidazole phosphoribosyltransferase
MSLTPLNEVISAITPADQTAMEAARAHWDSVAKPLGSLGLLEDAVVRAAGAIGTADVKWERKAVAVFCADNGVVAEGVTQTGQEVTAAVASAMARGEACVCRMAWSAGAEVFPVDIGMARPIEEEGILRRHVLRGTRSIAQGPAMTRSDAIAAVMTGVWLAEELLNRGFTLLAAGEMGIGNTTTSAAITSVLLDRPVEEVTGRGAGLSDAALAHKVDVIKQAIQVNKPNPKDPMDVLAKVGGLDIAAMAGFFLGAALCGVPVVLDGAISCAAALVAVRLCPNAAKALIASHRSAEPCGSLLLDALGLTPFITAQMRLGEGSGAVAAMPMLDMALSIYRSMSTFGDMGLTPYERQN